jgi:hypothetical protein
LAVFADPRSGIFDPGFGVCPDRESMPTWGNLALRMLRPVMPRFNTLLVGVHVIGLLPTTFAVRPGALCGRLS